MATLQQAGLNKLLSVLKKKKKKVDYLFLLKF